MTGNTVAVRGQAGAAQVKMAGKNQLDSANGKGLHGAAGPSDEVAR